MKNTVKKRSINKTRCTKNIYRRSRSRHRRSRSRHFGGRIDDFQKNFYIPATSFATNTFNTLLGPSGSGEEFYKPSTAKYIKENKAKISAAIGFLSGVLYYAKKAEENL